MSRIQIYRVYPTIPEPLAFLEVLTRNMWWSWQQDTKALFRRMDFAAWESSGENPIVFLNSVSRSRLEELASDDGFLAHLQRVQEHFNDRVALPVESGPRPFEPSEVIAYFSMEFGIHESLPLFAGGLGVLAGDHLKAASNSALPLVGVGLLYRNGYFRQFLDHHGTQQEAYPETDLFHIPVERARDSSGKDLRVSVTGIAGEMLADVWRINVGRIDLYLLDTNIHENPPEIRNVTARLYDGEDRVRLNQELLLGIGGMRALAAMGLYPKVCHMNEGHSVFSSIERLAFIMSTHQVDLDAAHEIVSRTTVFTTHTPVAAGHDEFSPDLVRPSLVPFEAPLGISVNEILSWGQPEGSGAEGKFSMAVLGLRMAQYCNGVSELHGKVARKMWAHVWPQRPVEEVPISHITNGIHVPSFISQEFALLFDRYLGPEWYMGSRKPENIDRIDKIYDGELWRAHGSNRSRLIRTCRERMKKQFTQRNAPQAVIEAVESVLDPDVLTIGFARRFATYKRATLILKDKDRLEALINSEKYPVQFIFAGKAHPKDDEGKNLIKELIEFAKRPGIRQKFIFLEDYDMHLARHMVQGVDVWLNNPRRPFEACGTSGMKAAVNGGLNVSILDGWWCEGYTDETGWAIGRGEDYTDWAYQDIVESQALYNVLENDVIPVFYGRKNGEVPEVWLKKMKASMKMAMTRFCSYRMIEEYREKFYFPAARRLDELLANGAEEARNIAAQSLRLRSLWQNIRIEQPIRDPRGPFHVGDSFQVSTTVFLDELQPDEVDVELYFGPLKSADTLKNSHTEPMTVAQSLGDGKFLYTCTLTCREAGRYGFTARITACGDDRLKFTPKLVTWS